MKTIKNDKQKKNASETNKIQIYWLNVPRNNKTTHTQNVYASNFKTKTIEPSDDEIDTNNKNRKQNIVALNIQSNYCPFLPTLRQIHKILSFNGVIL